MDHVLYTMPHSFMNNSTKNQPISITEDIWYKKNLGIYVPTSPTNCCRTNLGSAKSDLSTTFISNFNCTANLSSFPTVFMILRLWTMAFTGLHCSKCSKWPHSARVAAASVSEMDCIPAAHCRWADQITDLNNLTADSIHACCMDGCLVR